MVMEVHVKEEVPLEEGVEAELEGRKLRVKGPLGTVEKDFSHIKSLDIRLEDRKVIIEGYFLRKKEYALVRTVASHVKNMIIGVTKGFRYKMYIVYAHFPISVKVEGDKVIIENFLGSKDRRVAKIIGNVKVKVTRDEVIVEGVDIDAVAQTAANIHLATHLTGKRRLSPHGRAGGPGVLDGIYLYAKEHIK